MPCQLFNEKIIYKTIEANSDRHKQFLKSFAPKKYLNLTLCINFNYYPFENKQQQNSCDLAVPCGPFNNICHGSQTILISEFIVGETPFECYISYAAALDSQCYGTNIEISITNACCSLPFNQRIILHSYTISKYFKITIMNANPSQFKVHT